MPDQYLAAAATASGSRTAGNHRPIYLIARDIYANWRPVGPHAEPYVKAMLELSSIRDYYYLDSARDVVTRFLLNATTWRGPKAREIKAELRGMLKTR